MRRLRRAEVLVIAALLLVLSGFAVAGSRGPVSTGSAGTGSVPAPPDTVPTAATLGVFSGSDQRGVDGLARFGAWLGTTVTVGRAYLPGHGWDDLEGPDWLLDPWAAWRAGRPDRTLVLNVPMLAPNEPPLPDAEAAAMLRQGAAGAYDHHFARLGQRLVERGAADTVLVLGWEMNGTTYTSRCAPDAPAWRDYWRRIVATMRAVPGQRFRFDFAPVRGVHAISWPRCYPGDDVVDVIGMDSYDQAPGRTFADFIDQPEGLRAHVEFARARGKPISFPEWGLYDYGDNPAYVRGMHAWIRTHDVAYHSISDYCPHGVLDCPANPRASQAYRLLFGG